MKALIVRQIVTRHPEFPSEEQYIMLGMGTNYQGNGYSYQAFSSYTT